MDPFPLDEMLREREIVEADGMRIGVMHGGGSPHDIEARVSLAFAEERLDLIVYGHTHRRAVSNVGGRLLVNPGSATAGRFGERIRAGAAAPEIRFVNL